jgi:transcriptional regulator with XRE-family HTH domain
MAKNEIVINSVEDYGPALRQAREAQGLSQKQLADIMGVDQREVSRWEIGPNLVSPRNFLKAMSALNCTLLVRY